MGQRRCALDRAAQRHKRAEGVWLGGVVPYGYRKVGAKGEGRLTINEDPLPGFDVSEAEVVRTIYRLCTAEKKSCQKIADQLNRLGIPCSSAATGLSSQAGKRNRRNAPSGVLPGT